MTRYSFVFALILLILIPSFSDGQAVRKGSVSDWVSKIDVPAFVHKSPDELGGFYYLLIDRQQNVQLQETYYHYAYKILTVEGMQQMADITVDIDPAYQRVVWHSTTILRANEQIEKLPKADIKTLQREQSMDRYLYDGSITALVNLKDVRVGDVVEYSYTIKGNNPAYLGHFSDKIYFDFSLPYAKLFERILIPTATKLAIKDVNSAPTPKTKVLGNVTEYSWQVEANPAIILDSNSPSWYDPYRYTMLTDFSSWQEVASWATSHFEVSSIEKKSIEGQIPDVLKTGDSDAKIESTIRFVQDEIRYLGFESGLNSHKPHPPKQVMEQRYGDCKDKSLLLCVLLELQGVSAYPVLVNTQNRSVVKDFLPSAKVFNHCIVQITHSGHTFYVDPTSGNQGAQLSKRYFPNYGVGLLVSNGGSLIEIQSSLPATITEEQVFDITDFEKCELKIKTTYTGIEADIQRSEFANSTKMAIQQNYQKYYGNLYPSLQIATDLTVADDRIKNEFIVFEHYTIPSFWKENTSVEGQKYCEVYPLSMETYVNVNKFTGRKSPYKLSYPSDYSYSAVLNLPEDWPVETDSKIIETDYYKYAYNVKSSGKTVTLEHKYKTKAEEIPVKALEAFANDHQAMMNGLSYYLTYTKNQPPSNPLLVPIVILIVALLVGILLVIRLNSYNPPLRTDNPENLAIGGWLILVGIGISITPFRVLIGLLQEENGFFSTQTWNNILAVQNWSYVIFVSGELFYNVIYILFSILLAFHFFSKRTTVPVFAAVFYGSSLFFTVLDNIVAHALGISTIQENLSDLLRSLLVAIIWIPYFQYSERVENTFTQRI